MGMLGSIFKAFAQGEQLRQDAEEADQELLILRTEQEVEARLQAAQPLSIKADDKPQAKTIDPYDSYNMMDPALWGDLHPGTKGHALTFEQLDLLSRNPLVGSIIGARQHQVSEYAVPQRSKFEVGYAVALRDPRQQMSAAAQKRAAELERWVFTCGDPRLREMNTFENFLKTVTWDSLLYDQLCAEIVYDWNGKPAGFLPVDARTIRRARIKPKDQKNNQAGIPGYVQVMNSQTMATWKPDEFIFGVRNPRSDVRANGYGYPELEKANDVIGKLINTMAYNASNFTNGIHTAGILAITSAMDEKKFKQYERHIRSMMSGAQNANRAVVMQLDPVLKDAVNWLNVSNTNKEMEYSQWISFLLKVVCGCFQIDPAEIGFVFGNEGQSGALSQQGPGERIAASKERGLRPFLRFVQNLLNFKIIHKLDEDFELRLVGFDEATEARKLDYYNKAVRATLTLNEARAECGQSPLASPAASNGPLDGVFQSADQYATQQAQEQLQQQAMAGQLPGGEAPGIGSSEATPDMANPDGSVDSGGLDENDLASLFDSPEEMQKALPLLRTWEV
jgi:hypothetical protein